MKSLLFNGVVSCLETAARALLALKKPKIIAVTGSVGKTSTKLVIAHVLSGKYSVLAHKGSYNTEIGVPLSLFELEAPSPIWNPLAWVWIFLRIAWKLITPYPYQIVVQEIGADKPGDIERILRYIAPEIGVVTAVHPVHTELFGSLENIFKEKSLVALKSKRAVINGDDALLRERLLSHLTIPVTTYGIEKDASWKPSSVERNKTGELTMVFGDTAVETHIVAHHGLYALLAAGAVGEIFGIEKREIYKQLSAVYPAPGRMRVLEGKNGSTLLDDSYNA
ncbi:MAG: Mur ligase family protein, partial [bacterium]|nr:Mur ligase family protein [bacterium]